MKKQLPPSDTICISIAGFSINVIFLREEDMQGLEDMFINRIKAYYREFLVQDPKKIDFTLEVVHERTFKVMHQNNHRNVFINLYNTLSKTRMRTFFHLSGSQFQIIIRRISHELLVNNQGFILHGSASKKQGRAYVFLGNAGAGKSTITKLLQEEFSIAGDDSLILRKEHGGFYFYSSSAIERNAFVPKNFKRLELAGIFFLKKSLINKILPLKKYDTILKLLSAQLYSEKTDMITQLEYVADLINSFQKFHRLHFSLKNKAQLKQIINYA